MPSELGQDMSREVGIRDHGGEFPQGAHRTQSRPSELRVVREKITLPCRQQDATLEGGQVQIAVGDLPARRDAGRSKKGSIDPDLLQGLLAQRALYAKAARYGIRLDPASAGD